MADKNVSVEIALRAQTREYTRALAEAGKATQNFTKTLNTQQVSTFSKGISSLQKNVVGLVAATAGLQQMIASIARAGLEFDRVNRALTVATGSAEAAAKEFTFLSETADRLGLNIRATAGEYAKFAAAARGTAVEGQTTRDVFIGVSQVSTALGLTAEQVAGSFTALQQIMSKNKVQAEELTGQLGERIPGALAIASRAMNVTTVELYKMMEGSELLAEDFLPKFAKQLTEEFAPIAAKAADGPQAAFNRLNNAIYELQVSIAQGGLLDVLKDAADMFSGVARNAGHVTAAVKSVGVAAGYTVEAFSALLSLDFDRFVRAQEVATEQMDDYWQAAEKGAQAVVKANAELMASAQLRGQLETKLAAEIKRFVELQKQQTQSAAKAEIKAAEDAAKAQIKASAQSLQAKERLLQQGIRAEQDYTRTIAALRAGLTDTLSSDQDRLRALRQRDMTETERQVDIEEQIAEKIQAARRAAAEGDTDRAKAIAEQSKGLAEQINNTEKAEDLYRSASAVYTAAKEQEIASTEAARAAQTKANQETVKSIEEQKSELIDLRAELDAMTVDPKTIKLDVDISAAESKIDELQRQIDKLNRSITAAGSADGGPIPALAGGGSARHLTPGMIRGPGTGTSDSILARVSSGEHAFVTKASRAKQLWPLLNALNFGSDQLVSDVLSNLPAGLRTRHTTLASGGYAAGGSVSNSMQPVNIHLPGSTKPSATLFGEREQVQAFEDSLARWSRGYAT